MKKTWIMIMAVVVLFGIGGTIIYLELKSVENIVVSSEDLSTVDSSHGFQVVTTEKIDKMITESPGQYVYFYQPHCEFCKQIAPFIKDVADSTNAHVVAIDISGQPELWKKYNVKGTPSFVKFSKGQEVNRIVGAYPEEDFKAFFLR